MESLIKAMRWDMKIKGDQYGIEVSNNEGNEWALNWVWENNWLGYKKIQRRDGNAKGSLVATVNIAYKPTLKSNNYNEARALIFNPAQRYDDCSKLGENGIAKVALHWIDPRDLTNYKRDLRLRTLVIFKVAWKYHKETWRNVRRISLERWNYLKPYYLTNLSQRSLLECYFIEQRERKVHCWDGI